MTMCLLMLDFDHRLVSAVTRALADEGAAVVGAASVEDALAAITRQAFDAALLDADVIEADELGQFSSMPVILTTSFLEPEGGHRFFTLAPLLRKPFTSAQLLALLHDVCGTTDASHSGLVDILRRAHGLGRSLALEVGGARVFMEGGELVHAELESLVGECALAEVLARSGCAPRSIAEHAGTRTIQRPFQLLMLDLLRQLEEREQQGPLELLRERLIRGGKGPRS